MGGSLSCASGKSCTSDTDKKKKKKEKRGKKKKKVGVILAHFIF